MPRTVTHTIIVLFCALPPAFAQDWRDRSRDRDRDSDPAERYARAVRTEEEYTRKLGERVARPGETERDRWYKELDEVYTGRVPEDAGEWFDLVAVGRSTWSRRGSKFFEDFHEKVTDRLKLDRDTVITRADFAAYAAKYLGKDDSPPWREVDIAGPARGVFRYLDTNRDGFVSPDEASPRLRERFRAVDANADEKLTTEEYEMFFRSRVDAEARYLTVPEDRRRELPPPLPVEPKPFIVPGFDELPKEVPAWFRELDTDGDAQVGLYEWAADGRPIDEYQAMDLNKDGLLELAEYLRYRKIQAEEEERVPKPLKAILPGDEKREESKPPAPTEGERRR